MFRKIDLELNQYNPVTLFVIAFGCPMPMHRLITQHWGQNDLINFVVFTDKYHDWKLLCNNYQNIHLISLSIDNFLLSFCSILNCINIDEFDKTYGVNIYRNPIKPQEFRGWSTCALRPLISSIYNIRSPWWGWIDYDVFIDKQFLADSIAKTDLDALYYMPMYHPPWEQFKIFNIRCQQQMHDLYLSLITNRSYRDINSRSTTNNSWFVPLDAAFCRDFRKQKDIKFDYFNSFKLLSVHWNHTNNKDDWPGQDIRTDVLLDNKNNMLYTNNGRIMFFIADTETRGFSHKQVDQMLHRLKSTEYIEMKFKNQYDKA